MQKYCEDTFPEEEIMRLNDEPCGTMEVRSFIITFYVSTTLFSSKHMATLCDNNQQAYKSNRIEFEFEFNQNSNINM